MKHDRLNASGIVVAVFLSALVGTLLGRSVLQFLFMSQSFNNAVASHAAGAFLLMTLAYLLYDCYTLTVGTGSYPSEISWTITNGDNGNEESQCWVRPDSA